jgi:hypothetical protein
VLLPRKLLAAEEVERPKLLGQLHELVVPDTAELDLRGYTTGERWKHFTAKGTSSRVPRWLGWMSTNAVFGTCSCIAGLNIH